MHRQRKVAKKHNAPKEDPKLPGKGAVQLFHGVFIGYAVAVHDPIEVADLYACGTFGKGNLSRGKPVFGTEEGVMKKRRSAKKARATGFHVHAPIARSPDIGQIKRQDPPRAVEPEDEITLEKPEDDLPVAVDDVEAPLIEPEGEESDEDDDEDAVPNAEQPESKRPRLEPVAEVPNKPAVTEWLQLSLEEGFFLMYGLGVLEITDSERKVMTVRECWTAFCAAQAHFLSSYVAYHYYRSHAWCVKSGLKYGTEFVLYKKGPDYFHAEHAVLVVNAEQGTKRELPSQRPKRWPALLNVNRVSEQVAKGLVLCYVLYPKDWNAAEDSLSPECIKRFWIQEVQIKRSVP